MKAVPGEKIAAIADVVDEGLALCREGRIWWASERMASLLGCSSAEQLMGQLICDRLVDTGAGFPSPGGGSVCCAVRGSDEDSKPLEVHCVPVRSGELWLAGPNEVPEGDEAPEPSTSEALTNAQLEATYLRDELARMDRERDELFAVLSHDLRTPITVIGGYNRLLLSKDVGSLNAAQKHFLKESEKSCRRLDALVGSLLEVSRDGEGSIRLDIEVQDLKTAINDACDSLRPLMLDKKLVTEVQVDPEAKIAAFDSVRLGQVLVNLLNNAIRFSPKGAKIVIGSRKSAEHEGNFVQLYVADRGPGIAKKQRERIFKPYVRLVGKSHGSGLGLGLAICKRVVDAHGGTLWVQDEPAGGSRFTFTLPVSPEDIDAEKGAKSDG